MKTHPYSSPDEDTPIVLGMGFIDQRYEVAIAGKYAISVKRKTVTRVTWSDCNHHTRLDTPYWLFLT